MNPAFGAPGIAPTFAAGDKDAVLTAIGSSQVWATIGGGILNEVFWPNTGRPQLRDLGFLVTGDGWWVEVKRQADYTVSTPAAGVPLPVVTHHDPRFRLTLGFVCDPRRDVVLIKYRLEPTVDEAVALHLLAAPHLGGTGHHNTAWTDGGVLFASHGNEALAIVPDVAPELTSAGYVGASDAWQDTDQHGRPTWSFDRADDGNVALAATLANTCGVIAVGYATTPSGAAVLARSSLAEGFCSVQEAYRSGWADWQQHMQLPRGTARLEQLARVSATVLRIHEDVTFPGAIVASLATPWGAAHDDPGGYHLVWPRDCAESGLALAALGLFDDARRTLDFLAATQLADGHWAQNFTPDGVAYWTGRQLDETALPLLLAAKLDELGQLDPSHRRRLDPVVDRAARYLAEHGPASEQDRWEEAAGINPFTLAAAIAALAGIAGTDWLTAERRAELGAIADGWYERIDDWLWVTDTDLDRRFGTRGHYLRICPPDADLSGADGPRGTITIANRGGEAADITDQVGLEYLALVRYGLRQADDQRIVDTTRLVDALLGDASTHLYRRYPNDGYGEHDNGDPFDGIGRGRLWPLLAGERGHHALERGDDPIPYLEAMAASTTGGGMIPEQVWDAAPIATRRLAPGRPSGSAAPLVWAHAEFVKLYLATYAGVHADRLTSVSGRYAQAT